MINQVKTSNTQSAYAAFNTVNAAPYAISQPINKKQIEEKKHSHWLQITSIAVVSGFGIFALMKGLPKGARSWLNYRFRDLEDIIDKSENIKLSKFQAGTRAVLKKIGSMSRYVKALYNTAPLKDVLVKKSMDKVPVLKKASNWITGIFEHVSLMTSNRAYKSAGYNFENMYKNFDELNKKILTVRKDENIVINGISRPAKDWVAELEKKTGVFKEHYVEGFGNDARKTRLVSVKAGLKGIDEKVWTKIYGNFSKFLDEPSTYNSFISEDLAADCKGGINRNVNALRGSLTNDINDNYRSTKKVLKELNSFVYPADKESRTTLRAIRRILYDCRHGDISSESKIGYSDIKDISTKLNELNSHVSQSDLYDDKVKSKVADIIFQVNNQLRNNKKGELQEILTIYNKLLPKSDYEPLKTTTYSAVRSLDRAVDFEADKLFDKLRDLEIGAAPTDTLGLLSSVGIVGWGLSHAENNKERVSVALKYGIPAVGAVATTLYCTMGLVSGGASLALGLLSGVVISKAGVILDNAIKKQTKQEKSKI